MQVSNATAIFGQDIGRGQITQDFGPKVHKSTTVIHSINLPKSWRLKFDFNHHRDVPQPKALDLEQDYQWSSTEMV